MIDKKDGQMKRAMCREGEFWWLIKSLIKSSFFSATAWHHCLNESRERGNSGLWLYHRDITRRKACIIKLAFSAFSFLFSIIALPKNIPSFSGEWVECSFWGKHPRGEWWLWTQCFLLLIWTKWTHVCVFVSDMLNTVRATNYLFCLKGYNRGGFVEKVKVTAHIQHICQ